MNFNPSHSGPSGGAFRAPTPAA
ncbi:ATPase, partial [Mycobacterium avium subsp. hominissuis]|nr:ATPase [Mycobacterium avium subsp. hominissuis]